MNFKRLKKTVKRRVVCFLWVSLSVTFVLCMDWKEFFYGFSEVFALMDSAIPSVLKNSLIEKPDYLYNRVIFHECLKETKKLNACSSGLEKNPKAFVSYAWGNDDSEKEKIETKKIQKRLLMLQEDLEFLGIETFLDLKHMHGNIRHTIEQNLEKTDFVVLIGNPFLKKKADRDRLFFLPHYDPKLLPASDNCVVLVEGPQDYTVYRVEKRIIKETIRLPLALDRISWISTKRDDVKEAQLSKKTNAFLEEILSKFKSVGNPTISNVQFECGIVMDKAHQDPKILIPLLFEGSYEEAFPSVIQKNFIRDLRNGAQYFRQMSSLSDPLGIIPGICPDLIKNQDYIHLEKDLKKHLK